MGPILKIYIEPLLWNQRDYGLDTRLVIRRLIQGYLGSLVVNLRSATAKKFDKIALYKACVLTEKFLCCGYQVVRGH